MIHKLAGSQITGYVASGITFLGTVVCVTMRTEIEHYVPGWVCTAIIVLAAGVAWFSRSPINRRTGEDPPEIKLTDGTVIPNRRGTP